MPTHVKKYTLPSTIVIPKGTIGTEAPIKTTRSPGHVSILIAIGPDETAELVLHEDALRAMKGIPPEPFII